MELKNAFDSAVEPKKDIKALASWTGFISANDIQKLLFRPIFRHRRQKVARLVLMAVAMTR